MRSLIRPLVIALALAQPLIASQEPPPVALAHRVVGPVRLARPFVVDVTVASRTQALVAGELAVRAAAALDAGRSPGRVQLAAGATVTVSVPVVARRAGVHALELAWSTGGHDLASLTLFVQVGEGSGRVLSLKEKIAAEAIATQGDRMVFALKRTGALEDEPAPVVTGQLMFTEYAGGTAPGRRVHAELHGEVDGKRTLLASAEVDAEGRFTFPRPAPVAGRKLIPAFSLKTPRWTIQTTSSKAYAWEGPAVDDAGGGLDLGTLTPPQGQTAAQALWIHQELNRALDLFLASGADLSWWTSIPVQWPASGDFFSWSTVNLTKAHQWDVTGHEFGHAIFHYGSSAQGAGGQHKIDECYSKALAWSEGWASYFAAVIHEPRDAQDAKFEFMVPRRAPIRVENVPSDVCQGDSNEWRVAAALWDVYDTHADGADLCAVDFATMWAAMRAGNRVREVKKYLDVLRGQLDGVSGTAMDAAVKANTIQ